MADLNTSDPQADGSLQKGARSCRYDVIVCGDDLCAFATTALLREQGLSVVQVCCPGTSTLSVDPYFRVLWPTLPDPPTRLAVAHGHTVAAEVLCFLRDSAADTARWLASVAPAARLTPARCIRLAAAPHEQRELQVAAGHFDHVVVQRSVHTDVPVGQALDCGGRASPVFADEGNAAVLQGLGGPCPWQIFSDIEQQHSPLQRNIVTIEESSRDVRVTCAEGDVLRAELAVVSLGHRTAQLLPRFRDVAVAVRSVALHASGLNPVSDSAAASASSARSPLHAQAVCFRAASGHISGALVRGTSEQGRLGLYLSGPRYLFDAATGVPLAAAREPMPFQSAFPFASWNKALGRVLEELAESQPQWSHAASDLAALVGTCPDGVLAPGGAWRGPLGALYLEQTAECWPCDELPMLGEFGVHGRLLGSAGWLGCGESEAMACARVLADLALKGRPEPGSYPSLLSPRRFAAV